ncbi:MAG: trypsin-like peptidase domain-containing protein [bacterium]|nr:trypsin-like peptidase domain-containing protein [bacterium]
MTTESEDPRQDWDPWGWEPDEPASPQPRVSAAEPILVPQQPFEGVKPNVAAAEITPWIPPPPAGPTKVSNPSWAMLLASVVLAMLGLVGIGVGIGTIFFNRDTPPPEVVVVSAPPAQSTLPPQAQLPQAEVPVPVEQTSPSANSVQTVQVDPVVQVARAVVPSVVLIEVPGGDGQSEDRPTPPGDTPRGGQGSGIIYAASGLILTNAHVVDDAQEVIVQLADGTRAPGEVVGTASAVDVALVRVDTDVELTPAQFAGRSTVQVGQLAVAVGSPFGLQQSVTSGIVSAVGRAIREGSGAGAFVEMIQTDAPINPGNSGGALANRFGQVIGMNTLIRTDGSMGNIGLGFAIPTDIALNIAERILKGESTELGYLGVWGNDPELGLPGALVAQVLPGTPAERSGLQPDDLIVRIDGEPVATFTELAAKIQFRVPGTTAVLEVVRDGVNFEIPVEVGERSQFEGLQPTQEPEQE